MAVPIPDKQAARRAPRRKLFQPAELRHGARLQRVHLLDLSVAGGLIHMAEPPPVGSTVMLICHPVTRMARVAWATERRAGLAFLLVLKPAELEAIIGGG